MATKIDIPCHCGSKSMYEQCCYPLLVGQVKAKLPENLMRSRYTAYKLGGYGEYLYRTWTKQGRSGLTARELDTRDRLWLDLTVISSVHTDVQGIVQFSATFQGTNNQTIQHRETSLFLFENGEWKYDKALDIQ